MKRNSAIIFRTALVLACAAIMLFQFTGVADAKKIRFSVGFTTDETLESTRATESWQYSEMGCHFWPVLYDQLWIMGPAPDYKALPGIAASWETQDRQTWRFNLQKNAKFHDGRPVTAHDVEFTLTHLKKHVPAWDLPDQACEWIKVIDDHTVEFKLEAPLGGHYPPVYWTPVLPKHIWEPHKEDFSAFPNDKAIGSGRYKLKEFKSKQYVWFEANKDYWGGAPAVDELVFKGYGGEEALYLALKKGDIQMVGYAGISAVSLPQFKNDKNIKVLISEGIGMVWLTFNLHKKNPVQDLNVRKAIAHGTNVKQMIEMAYGGYAKPADSFIYPEMPEYNPNLPQYEYNPAKAKEILAGAGYTDKDNDGIVNDPKTGKNLSLELIVPSDWSSEVKMVTMLKQQLKAVGLEIAVKTLDLDTYFSFIYEPTGDKWDIAIGEEEPGPHADWIWEFLRSYSGGGEGWNQSYYDNAKFDEHLDAALSETEVAKRKAHMFEMQRMVAEDLPYYIMLRFDVIDPVRIDKWEGYVQTMGGINSWINPWTLYSAKPKK